MAAPARPVELRNDLREAVGELEELDRAALLMWLSGEFTRSQIAWELDITEAEFRTRFAVTKTRLANRLPGYESA